MYLGKKDH